MLLPKTWGLKRASKTVMSKFSRRNAGLIACMGALVDVGLGVGSGTATRVSSRIEIASRLAQSGLDETLPIGLIMVTRHRVAIVI